jgi:CDP-diacylglycerol--serine O-phosphatidyltransferase
MVKLRRRTKKRNIALILLRIILSFIIFTLIINNRKNLALYLFGLTAFVSFLDGFLAKKNKIRTQLSSILDPFADKVFVNLVAIALFFDGNLPYWVMALFLIKDLLVVIGALLHLLKNIKVIFKSNAIDKVSVFIQLFTLFTILMGRLDYILIYISVAFAVLSFLSTLFKSGIRVVSYRTDIEEIKFRNLIKPPDFLTFLNISMGLATIILAISAKYHLAILTLIFAAISDYLDGKVARHMKREGDFGKQLDSLADTVSFGVAPAIFGLTLIQTNIAIITFTLFLFAGVLRLARYNIMEFSGEFSGMPITVNGLVIPAIYLMGVPPRAYIYIYLFLAILMVSPLKFKKLF